MNERKLFLKFSIIIFILGVLIILGMLADSYVSMATNMKNAISSGDYTPEQIEGFRQMIHMVNMLSCAFIFMMIGSIVMILINIYDVYKMWVLGFDDAQV
ncbi:MAG: hypothetical protein HRS50_00265 [Mycoplasmataceae bacterium]|nr:hypothetical protein [Mycoplasmataceae bacterium]